MKKQIVRKKIAASRTVQQTPVANTSLLVPNSTALSRGSPRISFAQGISQERKKRTNFILKNIHLVSKGRLTRDF